MRKNHPRIEAVGALDELNAALGVARALAPATLKTGLSCTQDELIVLMGEVACPVSGLARYRRSALPKFDLGAVTRFDTAIAEIEGRHPTFSGWATPGDNALSAALDLARTVARRAERRLVIIRARAALLQYINRLSDLLWLQARDAETTGTAKRRQR